MKKLLPALILTVLLFDVAAQAATYEWLDEKGVVHFTDDPDRIPAKYLKRVKERDSVKGEATKPALPPAAESAAPAVSADNSGDGRLYGGYGEDWWRSGFASLRAEIKSLEDGLTVKRENLNVARRKRVIYQRGSDRVSFNDLNDEIKRDEAKIKELREKLNALDVEASRVGVPLEWRQ